ncbi:ABC transporter [candidate division LCP-89 bacterium B3_LCP]|uniref:ABC transporter n=1 Tax=candidate division LCP-89 bacterium B3_LCP TaxID=2012998 RepID=A0A532V0L6_UNCL8|nr:MAG: ABC transporter [candidate division LCP-89 bacterium B3_LCP]
MKEVIALAKKDFKLLMRDKTGFFFVLFFPLIFALFFGLIFSGSGGGSSGAIPIVLVDLDSTEASQDFAGLIEDTKGLKVERTDLVQARSLVQRGKRSAYLVLPEGFGETSSNLFWGEPTHLEIGVDPARKAETAMLEGMLTGLFMENMMKGLTDPQGMSDRIKGWRSQIESAPDSTQEELGFMDKFFVELDTFMHELETAETDTAVLSDSAAASEASGWQPLSFEKTDISIKRDGPKNPFEITFPQSIVWGLIGCAASFGISLVVERTRGTLIRLRVAPLQKWQILAGKALACFITTIIVAAMLFLFAVIVFGVRPDSLAMLAMAVISAGICFAGIMMLLAVLGKTEASAGGIGWAVLLIMAMTGGGMIPVFFMPSWMQTLGSLSPVKWAILALEGAVWRGFTFDLMLLHCGILVLIGLVCFTIGAKVFNWTAE